MYFKKKPIVIQAFIYDGKNKEFIHDFIDNDSFDAPENKISITTLEGDVTADVGDYIIKGIQGEFYPCKPDIFEQTYELVE